MTLSNDPAAYYDCRAHMDRALDSERGIKIVCDTEGQAISLRQRMYKYRTLTRKESANIYPDGDPLRGTSPYDRLLMRVEGKEVIVRKVKMPEVEEL